MSRACLLCEHTAIDQWDLCRRIEDSRGASDGFPSFTTVKRELDEVYDVETTVTTLKKHIDEHMHGSAVGACLVRAQLYSDAYETGLGDISETSPYELAGALPDRPLTESELSVLASHPDIDGVHGEPLNCWYSGLPDELEDDIHALWIEVDDELVTLSFRIEGIQKTDEYTLSMEFAQTHEWVNREVTNRDDLVDAGMLYRDDYYHLPQQESIETVKPSFDGALEFADDRPLHPDDVRDLPSKEIVEWLRRFGVEFREDQFREEIEEYPSASELAEHWWETYSPTAAGYDEDFIWMAAMVLWERLETDIMNSEQLDRMMQEGYDKKDNGDVVQACRLWLDVWDNLQQRFTDGMTHIHDADQRVFSGMQSLYNWCQDLEMELGNAGRQDPVFYERRIEYCQEFCDQFPDTDRLIIQNMRRAEAVSLFKLGRLEEGEAAFAALTDDYPNYGWGYIKWGDMYREKFHGNNATMPVDTERAAQHYRDALSQDIETNAEKAARNRLTDLEA